MPQLDFVMWLNIVLFLILCCYVLYYFCTLYILQNIAVTKKIQNKLYNFLFLNIFTKSMFTVSYIHKTYLIFVYYNVLKNINNDLYNSLKSHSYKLLVTNIISTLSVFFGKNPVNTYFLIKNLYLKNI